MSYQDDELRSAVPAKRSEARANLTLCTDNPFMLKTETTPVRINTQQLQIPPTAPHNILSSPDLALGKKGVKARTVSPVLQKLTGNWAREDVKSEYTKCLLPEQSIPPGTPQSACTFTTKNLNKTIDTTLSLKSKISIDNMRNRYLDNKNQNANHIQDSNNLLPIGNPSIEIKSEHIPPGCCNLEVKSKSERCCIII